MEYRSPQEREADRRARIAEQQAQENALKDSTKQRETRRCQASGCGRSFWCPPGSARRYCTDHGHLEYANYE